MTCHDARELLSALIDDALDASERASADAHLVTCAECRRELEQLRSAVTLLRAVEPARAPVGFVDRVLDAARPAPWHRRLLNALFLPWPVKLPAEAAAVVLVAVGVVYLYNATPELQQASRLEPAQAPTEIQRQPAPEIGAGASVQAPRQIAAPETTRLEAPVSPRPATPEAQRPAESETERLAATQPPPASPPQAMKEPMEKERLKDDSRDADKQTAARPARDARERANQEREQAKSAQAPESRADAQAFKRQAAPSAAASFVPPDVSGRLSVSDRDAALRGLDELIARLGATVDRRVAGSEGPIFEISIARGAYAEFVRELARLGRWQPTREPAELPAQIRIVVRIAG